MPERLTEAPKEIVEALTLKEVSNGELTPSIHLLRCMTLKPGNRICVSSA
ncbi:protein of unknown function (plasmid) [Cupriavidus taiwanensis]|uniref:Uncharacterized protein n=1 Tax=Cupriavidus taiwanensis TaxID=164546 RepID=A0A375IMW1_9BURK|nr:protein of unknown function [Cupriavidus taiwanensis]